MTAEAASDFDRHYELYCKAQTEGARATQAYIDDKSKLVEQDEAYQEAQQEYEHFSQSPGYLSYGESLD